MGNHRLGPAQLALQRGDPGRASCEPVRRVPAPLIEIRPGYRRLRATEEWPPPSRLQSESLLKYAYETHAPTSTAPHGRREGCPLRDDGALQPGGHVRR